MSAKFKSLLTADERIAGWKFGFCMKCAEAGIRPSQIDQAIKEAAGPSAPALLSPTGLAKAIATVAIITGVPLGVAAHVIGRHMTQARGRENELQAQAGYYRNAAQQLGDSLSAAETEE